MVSFSLVAVYDTGECFYFEISISFLLKSACVPTMTVRIGSSPIVKEMTNLYFFWVCVHTNHPLNYNVFSLAPTLKELSSGWSSIFQLVISVISIRWNVRKQANLGLVIFSIYIFHGTRFSNIYITCEFYWLI